MAKKKKANDNAIVEQPQISGIGNALSYKINIKCLTQKQKELVNTIKENQITFVRGVFGVGKTFIINSVALQMLKDPDSGIRKIVLIVPTNQHQAMSIGLLPGDLNDKVSAFSINEYDAFKKILRKNENCCPDMILDCLIKNGLIEIRPISFLRGASLENSFICVSEAEEFTKEELFLILTRFESGKMVISGDPFQAYRGNVKKGDSGLLYGIEKLSDIDGIGVVEFEDTDIVRNDILLKIYHKWKS